MCLLVCTLAILDCTENMAYFRKSLQKRIEIKRFESGAQMCGALFESSGLFYHGAIIIGRKDMLTEKDNHRRVSFYKMANPHIDIFHYDWLVNAKIRFKSLGLEALHEEQRKKMWVREEMHWDEKHR